MPRLSWFLPRALLAILIAATAVGADPNEPKKDAKKDPKRDAPYTPLVHEASKEGEEAIKRFQYDKSLKVDLWAAEPMLANPVCFSFDEKGRCFVAETFRHSAGAVDNRGRPWLDDDLACRTVEERVAMFKKYAKSNFSRDYETEHDRVRLIEDTTGSGRADKATVFRNDFGHAADGIGAGLLARNGNVYFTCIPDLWLLKDTKGIGQADLKQSLSTGYGVHVAFIGHDLHGLRLGPDGKLYFSLGDRGLNVKTKEGKHLFNPDSGAVLRCDLDGANLEIVHIGLRNPQELAFDDYGNLFTVDNNSDSGDRARFVQIVEGGDSGWRIGYQYGSEMHDPKVVKQGNRGPWNYEKLWHPYHEGQPAYIVPPLANFADGPSGFTHYPGVGLGDKYKGHFFLCDFRGSAGGSGVWHFSTKPKGASFEMVEPKHFVWDILATDCDFAPDCGFYISDWTNGWDKPGKGRLYRVSDPEEQRKEVVKEVKAILAKGFDALSVAELTKLLGHPHQQVRMEAQFALAAKGKDGIEPLTDTARNSKNQLARIHAIWGLGMIARKGNDDAVSSVLSLKEDADEEIRAQVAKVLGWDLTITATETLVGMLNDKSQLVQFFALQSLARADIGRVNRGEKRSFILAHAKGLAAIFSLAFQNADKDPYLRYALSRAMAALMIEHEGLEREARADTRSSSTRLVSVLARRHSFQRSAAPDDASFGQDLEAFLADVDPRVVAEAVRTIHDLNLHKDLPKLAGLVAKANVAAEVMYRALDANYRLGNRENAAALAEFASKANAPEPLRILALKMLGAWPNPPRRDFITGLTQDLKPRDGSVAATAIKSRMLGIFAGSANVQKEAAAVAGKLGITEVSPFLFNLVSDAKASATARIEALSALDTLKDKRTGEAVATAIASNDPRIRNAGRAVLIKTKPIEVVAQLKEVLDTNDSIEKQGALALLAEVKSPEVDDVIESWLDKLMKKEAPAELQLDIIESAAKRNTVRLKRRLQGFEDARPKGDELGKYRETLVGGDAERGRNIFLNNAAVSCQRCHKLDGEGGDVGPPLNGIATRQKRDYLLESLVLPNKQIAKGYDSVLITKADGKTVTGVLKSEDAKEVKVMTAEGVLIVIKKDDIDDRKTTKSAMPDDLVQKLSKHEIRDLVEFLAGLKEEWKK